MAAAEVAIGYTGDVAAEKDFDVVVVGAGPAGSVAALTLARGGARVCLVDKATFPRDKACGDLVGPRGVALLEDLGVEPAPSLRVADMEVVGPGGGRAHLPALAGRAYPGFAWAALRRDLDQMLRDLAIEAGARPLTGRAGGLEMEGQRTAVLLDDGRRLLARGVVGADGATSALAAAGGLSRPPEQLWGFAVRAYVDAAPPLPLIVFWEPSRLAALPGYGWLFPGPRGKANVGIGIGTGSTRRGAAEVARLLPDFLEHLRRSGLIDACAVAERSLGGWLRMGMGGSTPAAGRVLLVGDAAGLVNPLQGEGIAQAIRSAHAAATAILADPARPAPAYRRWLREEQADFQGSVGALQRAVLPRRRTVGALGRALTWAPLGNWVGPAWGLYWNDLVAGAEPGAPGVRLARLAGRSLRVVTAASRPRRALSRALAG